MQISLSSGLLLVGIVQGLFLSATMLAQKAGPRKANLFLVGLLLAFVGALGLHWATLSGAWKDYPHLYVIGSPVIFLFGPALYLYVQQLTHPERRLSALHLLHLGPFALNLMAFLPLLDMEAAALVDRISPVPATPSPDSSLPLLPTLKLLAVMAYTVAAAVALGRHAARVKAYYTNMDAVNLRWLRSLVYAFLGLEICLALILAMGVSLETLPNWGDTLIAGFLVMIIFFTGFKGLHQPELFRGVDPQLAALLHVRGKNPHQPSKPDLSDEEREHLERTMKSLFEEKKVYLDPVLDLRKLAKKSGTSTHKLSYFLNTYQGRSFYDHVNGYRILHAQKALAGDGTILEIAFQSGFNNKATFNKAFKKETGETPSQFRKKLSPEGK